MALLERLQQIVAAVGTDGTFTSGNMIAGNAKYKIFEPRPAYNVGQFERQPYRATIGAIANVPGARYVEFTFNTEVNGSGTPGVAPVIGPLLRACGFSETASTGSAAISGVTADPNNLTPATVPTVTGTYAHTVSGRMIISVTAIVTDTSLNFSVEWRRNGTASQFYEGESQTGATGVTLSGGALDGVIVDFGNPDTDTDLHRVGDKYYITLTSDQQVDVKYKPISDSIPCLDFGLYQNGRRHTAHSCRGNVQLVASAIGQPMIANWRFMGIINDIADAALMSNPAYENIVAPPFIGVGTTIGGTTPQCFNNISIDMGNNVQLRECATSATGYSTGRIGSRRVTMSINPLGALVATTDPWSDLFDGTTRAFHFDIGETAGNIVEVDAVRAQTTGITVGERAGDIEDARTMLFTEPEYDAGGDYAEIELTFR